MAKEYIDKTRLMQRIHTGMTLIEAMQEIIDAPAADVAPVRHGRFLGTEFDGYADGLPVYYEWQCSECGRIFEDEEPAYEFCPYCGAKMDGGQDDGD